MQPDRETERQILFQSQELFLPRADAQWSVNSLHAVCMWLGMSKNWCDFDKHSVAFKMPWLQAGPVGPVGPWHVQMNGERRPLPGGSARLVVLACEGFPRAPTRLLGDFPSERRLALRLRGQFNQKPIERQAQPRSHRIKTSFPPSISSVYC